MWSLTFAAIILLGFSAKALQIEKAKFKRDNYKNMISRGVKNHYKKFFFKPVGCLSSLNVQNIYNAIMKDLSICEES